MKQRELGTVLATQDLQVLFQPILRCRNGLVFGYEALIRGPAGSELHSPLDLFEQAGRSGRLAELDLLCRRLAIQRFAELELPGRLFLNVTPEVVSRSDFPSGETRRYLEGMGLDPLRVVIELTEHYPIRDYGVMRTAVEHYRAMGFSVAIDDLGAGHSSLRLWSELRPDFVKIDRHFIQKVDGDPGKREFIRSILAMATGLDAQVVAEGVETLEEYRCLWSLGVELAQGFHFARPLPLPPREIVTSLPAANGEARPSGSLRETALSLLKPAPAVSPETPAAEVTALFQRMPELRSIAVVADHRPLGIVRRADLMNLFATPFGRSLHSRRKILDLAAEPLIAEQNLPLEDLSTRITGTAGYSEDNDFIVVDEDHRYLGIGTLMDLLRRITELQIRRARYANPLTGLPGNVPIDERIARSLSADEPTTAILCDIDHFKAYNDRYGYRRGDDVIVILARLLGDYAQNEDFVGHIGGDDFVLLLHGVDWRERCEQILADFGVSAPWFYNAEDRAQGGIHSVDRQGVPRFFPIMSISLGALRIDAGRYDSPQEVAARLNELKGQAKRTSGNSLFVERRGAPPRGRPAQ